MMKPSKIFIFALFASICPALLSMEQIPVQSGLSAAAIKRRKKRLTKCKPLRIKILKREAHKAEFQKNSREEAKKQFIKKEFIHTLYAKYKITEQQGLSLEEICGLSQDQKNKLLEILLNRNRQLLHKLCSHSGAIKILMNNVDYCNIVEAFNGIATQNMHETLEAYDCNTQAAIVYALQQSRRTKGALLWTLNEIIAKHSPGFKE